MAPKESMAKSWLQTGFSYITRGPETMLIPDFCYVSQDISALLKMVCVVSGICNEKSP